MNKIRKGDNVIVTVGKAKKCQGTVLARLNNYRVLIEGLNLSKKHLKANPSANNPGGIIEKSTPVHISNIALLNPDTGRIDRVKIKKTEAQKFRVFRSNGAPVSTKT